MGTESFQNPHLNCRIQGSADKDHWLIPEKVRQMYSDEDYKEYFIAVWK